MSIFGEIYFYSPLSLPDGKCEEIVAKCQEMIKSWKCTYDNVSECIIFDYIESYKYNKLVDKILELAQPMKLLNEYSFFSESNFMYNFDDRKGTARFYQRNGQCVEIVSIDPINHDEGKIYLETLNLDNFEYKEIYIIKKHYL